MKKLGLLVVAALIAGPAMADNHDVKVSGQVFANHLLSGGDALKDRVGFAVERARVKVDAKFNDTWKAHVAVEGTNVKANGTFVKKAYIKGKSVFQKGDHFRFGVAGNTWKDMLYKKSKNRWIEKLGVHALGYNNSENHGFRYGNFSNMFKYSVAIHNGTEDATVAGQVNEQYGMEAYLGYDINKAMGLHLLIDNRAEAKKNTTANKEELTAFAFNYNAHMLDAVVEYGKYKNGTADDRSFTALFLTYNYSDKNGVYASMRNHDSKEEAASNAKSSMTVGHQWMLAKGLQTGLFYNAVKGDVAANDSNSVVWRWNAKF